VTAAAPEYEAQRIVVTLPLGVLKRTAMSSKVLITEQSLPS
jgi:hypothetical protein